MPDTEFGYIYFFDQFHFITFIDTYVTISCLLVGLNNDINGSVKSDTDGFGSSDGVNNCAGIVGSDLYVTSSDNVTSVFHY